MRAKTTTTSQAKVEQEVMTEEAEKEIKTAKKIEKTIKAKPKAFLDYCAFCNKKLSGFVAANGLRFCSDDCVKEYFK